MSLSRQDVILGRALMAWGLVDRERLVECANLVRRSAATAQPVTLGQVLVRNGLLSIERYQAIVGRLRQVYLAGAEPGMQQATAQVPQMNESGRYTKSVQRPNPLEESTVDRAVKGWQQVAPKVMAAGDDIEFVFDASPAPAAPAAKPAAPPPAPAPAPAPSEPPAKRAGPDGAVRRRMKVPPGQERFGIGAWTVEQYLADGAWGIVYRVSRTGGDNAPFALKVLKHLDPSPEIRQRFVQEARTMAKLTHPGIVHVHDAGVQNGMLWFVMDFQPGPNLKSVLDDGGPMSVADGLRVMLRLCDSVAYAHSNAVLHRDLKPDNIIMADGREPILTDFGLAKDTQSTLNLTTEGQRIGTPLYMAPELLLEAEKATEQSEVYALGAILYQLLAGKVPFFAKSVIDLAELIEGGKMTPLRKLCPEAPKELEKLCQRALDKDPKKRPQSVAALRDALKALA